MSKKLTPTFQQDAVEVIEQNTVFQGFFRFDKLRLKTRRFDGSWSDTMSRCTAWRTLPTDDISSADQRTFQIDYRVLRSP